MSNLHDITPKGNPVAVLRNALEKAQSEPVQGVFVLLIGEEGDIWSTGTAYTRDTLVCVLEKMKISLLFDGADNA